MKLVEGKLKVVNGKKIAIVSTRWNHFIVDRLVEGAYLLKLLKVSQQ